MKIILLILLVALPSTVLAQDFNQTLIRTFSAKVSNVGRAADLLEKGNEMGDIVSVQVPSIIFSPPLQIPDVRNSKLHNQPAIDTLIKYTKACVNGSAAELSKFWLESERNDQLALFSDPKALKTTHDYFNKNSSITILGLIFKDKKITILTKGYVMHPEYILGLTFIEDNGVTYLTNSSKDDLDLSIIEASFMPMKIVPTNSSSAEPGVPLNR